MDQHRFNQGLAASPTPFHAVEQMAAGLAEVGFERLAEADAWSLRPE